jgi:predicted PurR-regulated permease PerM
MSDSPSRADPTDLASAAPDFHQLKYAVEDRRTGSWALTGIFVLAFIAALYFARDLVLPIILALILSAVFSPVVRGLQKLRIPAPLGAGLLVVALLVAFFTATYNLAEPAGVWLDKAPLGIGQIGVKLRRITGQFKEVTDTTEQVKQLAQEMTNGGGNGKRVQEVSVKAPSWTATALAAANKFALTAISTLTLLYFLLASGDFFLRKMVSVTPRLRDKKRAVEITRQIEAEVSSYLITVTVINVGLGGAVALALYALDVPNPALWGVMVGLFNFVPYLGDMASVSVLTVVGLLTFDELGRGLLVPAVFCVLTAAEGYVVTPLVLGRRLSLNPVVIVLAVLFWGWMWGLLGALLAVPILVVVKTFCDRVEPLQAFGEFLGA